MKLPSDYNARQLLSMLGEALGKEQDQWKPYNYTSTDQVDKVTANQRNETIQWFVDLARLFEFYPETVFLSTVMLDKVLNSVKVRPKYLKCIGISCFIVAAKTLEEDEMVPSILKFVQKSGCGCSVAEVLRMERRVLDILCWNWRLVTPLDFLHILHASLLSSMPHLLDGAVHMTPGRQLSLLTNKLQKLVAWHEMLQFPSSVLALAVISLELQQFLPQWFMVTHIMQKHIQVSDEELIRCMETASQVLNYYRFGSSSKNTKSRKTSKSGTPTKKRKVAISEGEDDDIYEGIKRLYSEESNEPVTSVAVASCGGELRQEDSTCTSMAPLQTVVN